MLASRQDVEDNADYLIKWVGEDNYRKVLALYPPGKAKQRKQSKKQKKKKR